MSQVPSSALRVGELVPSLDFYHRALGFPLTRQEPEADIAEIDVHGYPLLLAGPGADPKRLPSEYSFVRPGGTVHAYAPDLDAQRDQLATRGVQSSLEERWWGERRLIVAAPDGIAVSFWTDFAPSCERTLDLLAQGVGRLRAVLDALPAGALDRPLRPGQWSARLVVHHLADTTLATFTPVHQALTAPGSVYHGAPFDQDGRAETRAYAARPIEPWLARTEAAIGQLTALTRAMPDAWGRDVQTPPGARLVVGRLLPALASHLLEHVAEIEAAAWSDRR